jgi:S1-C subfamily serine protease
MKTTDKYIGLDVHKDTTVIAVAAAGRRRFATSAFADAADNECLSVGDQAIEIGNPLWERGAR